MENLFPHQMMAMTAIGYLIAWGPFASLCIWEMITEPTVRTTHTLFSVKFYIEDDERDNVKIQ